MPERPPVGESQSNGIIKRAVGLVASQARTLKAALEHRIGVKVPPDPMILCLLVEFAAYLMNRCTTSEATGKRRNANCMDSGTTHRFWHFGRRFCTKTRAANVRRILESERWDADRILGMRAVLWSPDGSDNAFDVQVGMERPAEVVPRSPG